MILPCGCASDRSCELHTDPVALATSREPWPTFVDPMNPKDRAALDRCGLLIEDMRRLSDDPDDRTAEYVIDERYLLECYWLESPHPALSLQLQAIDRYAATLGSIWIEYDLDWHWDSDVYADADM